MNMIVDGGYVGSCTCGSNASSCCCCCALFWSVCGAGQGLSWVGMELAVVADVICRSAAVLM